MTSISIVIPNYNGADLLAENLPYVYNALTTSAISDFEVIVADDASTDHSVPFLQTSYPDVIVVQNRVNRGFAGNTNSGIRVATKELVFILNSDVQLGDAYFVPLLRYFRQPGTFGVMGRITSLDGQQIQDGAKYPDYQFSSIVPTKNYICKDRSSLYSLFMSGANSLIDRQKLLQLGGFNELFNPYYFEDVDLGLSAWEAGYKIYYEHTAVCRHPNSVTIKKQPSAKVSVIAKRNKFLLHYLHLDGPELWFYLASVTLKALLRLLIFDLRYARAYGLFVQSIGSIDKQNRAPGKTKNLKDIARFIQDDIKNHAIETF